MSLLLAPHIPTGLPIFDEGPGHRNTCPGLPKGRMTLVRGAEGQGKSMVAMKAAANLQAAGLRVGYLDLNGNCSPERMVSLGLHPGEASFILMQPLDIQGVLEACTCLIPITDVLFLDGLRVESALDWDAPLALLKQAVASGIALVVLGTHFPVAWKFHSHRFYDLHSFRAPGTITFWTWKDAFCIRDGKERTFGIRP